MHCIGRFVQPRAGRRLHNEPMIKVSVVILTWNSVPEVGRCLASLRNGLTVPHEVIVIDNGSQDETVSMITRQFPKTQLVKNDRNCGVAPARNQGLRLARGEYVLILDDDTIIHPTALDHLVRLLDTQPDVGLCGPKLLDADGQLCLSCRLFPTLLDKLGRRFPSALTRHAAREAELVDWAHDTTRRVDYVIGACQMIRRTALTEVGLLDENIFYGPEDIDLCLRMYQAGWRVVYHPQASVTHAERRVARSALSRLGWKHVGGLIYYFWKHKYLFSRQTLYARFPKSCKSCHMSEAL